MEFQKKMSKQKKKVTSHVLDKIELDEHTKDIKLIDFIRILSKEPKLYLIF